MRDAGYWMLDGWPACRSEAEVGYWVLIFTKGAKGGVRAPYQLTFSRSHFSKELNSPVETSFANCILAEASGPM